MVFLFLLIFYNGRFFSFRKTLMSSDQKNLQILLDFYFYIEIENNPNETMFESLIYLPFSDLADDKSSLGNVII